MTDLAIYIKLGGRHVTSSPPRVNSPFGIFVKIIFRDDILSKPATSRFNKTKKIAKRDEYHDPWWTTMEMENRVECVATSL